MPGPTAYLMDAAPAGRREHAWRLVEWLLLAAWLLDAALVMSNQRGGFLTNHTADLALPAWLYVGFRRHRGTAASNWRRRLSALPPVALAGVFFVASSATEASQYFWPHGVFAGTFDPTDIVAYGIGLVACCAADFRWPIPDRLRPAT